MTTNRTLRQEALFVRPLCGCALGAGIAAAAFALTGCTSLGHGDPALPVAADRGVILATRHTRVSVAPPAKVPTAKMVDGLLMGNGDVGVVLGGVPERIRFFIGKNDFWSVRRTAPAPVGRIEVASAALAGGGWHAEQDLALGEIRGTFAKGAASLATRSWVDANDNLFFTELRNTGSGPLSVSILPFKGQVVEGQKPEGTAFLNDPYNSGDPKERETQQYPNRNGKNISPPPPEGAAKVAVHCRFLGKPVTADGRVTLLPGEGVTVAAVILSGYDAKDCVAATAEKAGGLNASGVAARVAEHRKWWAGYWARSFIEIPDKTLEGAWYAALYALGSCSRAGETAAPGLWGNWITQDKIAWHGAYFLNYNFEAAYYGVYANNHADLSEPFYRMLAASVPEGRAMAARYGCQGVFFPVAIGPWGWRAWGDDAHLGQRSNAAYAALNFIWYYQYTQDREWLRRAGYPYLREVEKFWTGYLKLEPDPAAPGRFRYVSHADSVHECSDADMNPVVTLGLLRTLYGNLLTMSAELGVDAELQPKWRDILNRLSTFPTQQRDGKTVFRYTEKGTAWWDSNTVGIQHIYPAGAIGLDSDPALLEMSRNTIDALSRWEDDNGTSSLYAAAMRVGYDPRKILTELRRAYDRHVLPNGLMAFGGGGIENSSAPLQLSEMLMQSYDGVLRLFPCWSRDCGNAKFGTLRARGAFLVSAELKNGVVCAVRITSEKGRDLTIVNPWPGKKVKIVRNGRTEETELATGGRFTLKTAPGAVLELTPWN